MNLTELLTKQQEKHAISLTHDKSLINNDNIDNPEITDTISSEWEEKRNAFIDKFPIAKKMFTENGEGPYRLRYKNVEFKQNSKPDPDVFEFLQEYIPKITYMEYKAGIVNYNNQQTKIGKLLQKFKASRYIIDAYAGDIYKQDNTEQIATYYDIIITGHPIDVYGMSTGREWTSCADMMIKFHQKGDTHKDAAGTMADDINEHTHLAYLLPVGGNINDSAIARRSYKLMTSKNDSSKVSLLPDSSKVYNKNLNVTEQELFKNIADKLMNQLFKVESGLWQILDNLYNDGQSNNGDGIFLTDNAGVIFDLKNMTRKQVTTFIDNSADDTITQIIKKQATDVWNSGERSIVTMFCKSQADFLNTTIPHNLSFIFNISPYNFDQIKVAHLKNQPYPIKYANMLPLFHICSHKKMLSSAVQYKYNKSATQKVIDFIDSANKEYTLSQLYAVPIERIFPELPANTEITMSDFEISKSDIVLYIQKKQEQNTISTKPETTKENQSSPIVIIKNAIRDDNENVLNHFKQHILSLHDIFHCIADDITAPWILQQKAQLESFANNSDDIIKQNAFIFNILKPKILPALQKFKLQSVIDKLYP